MSGIHFLLVDGLNLVRRVYAAQPGEDDPEHVQGALTSSVASLQRALRECQPTHAACVFEGEGPSWRHKRYEGYKAGRSPMPGALKSGMMMFEEAFGEEGIPSLRFPNLEADDVIATLATKVSSRQGDVTILSTDKVFLQLLSDRIRVRDHFRQRDLDRTHVKEKFGVEPDQLVDFLALTGDSTNNIKGVPGVGSKTAARLLAEFGTLDEVLARADTVKGRLGEALRDHVEALRISRSLVCLRSDIQLGLNLRDLRFSPKTRAAQ
jgi:protein Xni